MNGGNALGAFFSELRQKNSARRGTAERSRSTTGTTCLLRARRSTPRARRHTRAHTPHANTMAMAMSALRRVVGPSLAPASLPRPPRRARASVPRAVAANRTRRLTPRPSSARRLPPQARQRLRAPRDRRALRRPRDADARVHRPRRGRVRGADRRQARRRVRRPIDPRAVATTALLSERKRNETRATRSMAIPRPSPSYARPPPAPFSRRHAIPTSPSLAPTPQTSSRATRTTT